MKYGKLIFAATAGFLLSGCMALPVVVGGATYLGLNKYGNDQREKCSALLKKAAAQKQTAKNIALAKSEQYDAGCR